MITYLSTVIILKTLPFMQFYSCPNEGTVKNYTRYADNTYQYLVEVTCGNTVEFEWIDGKLLKIKESK